MGLKPYIYFAAFILKLQKFFHSPKQNIIVFFDGDSVNVTSFMKLSQKISAKIKYIWVTPEGSSIPKKVRSHGCDIVLSPNIGKESVDMLIAMLAMQECCANSQLKEIHIVSSDGDTLEILLNLASRFTGVNFFWTYLNDKPRSQKSINAGKTIPKNIHINKVVCK
jgi:uncharacterized LabA/DUF88 family protein